MLTEIADESGKPADNSEDSISLSKESALVSHTQVSHKTLDDAVLNLQDRITNVEEHLLKVKQDH